MRDSTTRSQNIVHGYMAGALRSRKARVEQDRKVGVGGAAPQISVRALALQCPEDTMESVRKKINKHVART